MSAREDNVAERNSPDSSRHRLVEDAGRARKWLHALSVRVQAEHEQAHHGHARKPQEMI